MFSKEIDFSNKVIKDRLTASIGNAWSYMAFLGQYENAVNILLNSIVGDGNRVDVIAHPLLYLMRHSIELGYKSNLDYFKKYSGLEVSGKIAGTHNLQRLHQESRRHVEAVIAKHDVHPDTIDQFNQHYTDAGLLISELGEEEASSFRYHTNIKGLPVFDSTITKDVGRIKQLYDKAIVMLVHTSDALALYTDYEDLMKKIPDFDKGIGQVYHVFPSWMLNDLARIVDDQYLRLDSLLWSNEQTGELLTILTVEQKCYFLRVHSSVGGESAVMKSS